MPEKLLSDLAVRRARLPAGKKEQLLGDGANLFLRLRPESRDWLFVWKADGKKQKVMLGSLNDLSLSEARERARDARALVADGKHPRVEREKRRIEQLAADRQRASNHQTVNALFEDWWAREVKPRNIDEGAEVRRRLEKDVLPKMGSLHPYAVEPKHVAEILDAIADRGANRIAGHVLADLRQMFKFAVRRKLAAQNPTDDMRKADWNGDSAERERNLSESELLRLRAQLPNAKLLPETECAIWIVLGTACRIGELSKSRWEYIEGDVLTLPREITKTKEPHRVVLSPFVQGQLKRLRELNPKSEWLFPAKHHDGPVDEKSMTKQVTHRQGGKVVKGRSPAVTSLCLPGGKWHMHDLRRTAATLMQELDVDQNIIEAVLNHTEPNKVKRIYQRHKYEAKKRDAWLRLGAWLENLMVKKMLPPAIQ